MNFPICIPQVRAVLFPIMQQMQCLIFDNLIKLGGKQKWGVVVALPLIRTVIDVDVDADVDVLVLHSVVGGNAACPN